MNTKTSATSNGVHYIDELSEAQLRGRRVLVRSGFDVATTNGEVSELYRIEKGLPTIMFLKNTGARVIILSHIGRAPEETNAPVARALQKYIPLVYVPDIIGSQAKAAIAEMKDGDVILLENLRRDERERGNDGLFAGEFAQLGDLYVNDAFSNTHRKHASMVSLPKLLPSYGGFLLRDEIAHLKKALKPPRPALAIIGGAKFETKDPVIRLFLERYNDVCVVGAIANDILKARGFPVGRSRISEHAPDIGVANHPRLLAPDDVVVERSDEQVFTKHTKNVGEDDLIADIGPESVAELAPLIERARFILWNGPTGVFEKGHLAQTETIAKLIAKSSAEKIIGGGDTIAAIQTSGVTLDNLGFVSTGGGAMLEYLLKGTLPAIEALGKHE